MSDERILMDGSERDQTPRSGVSPLLIGIAGLLAGALGALALVGDTAAPAPDDDPEPEGFAASAPSSSTTTTVPVSGDPSLAEQVPGFFDTLVAAGVDTRGMPTVERWPAVAEAPGTTPLPPGNLQSDISNTWLRIVSDQRYGDGRLLWVGNESFVEPVSTGVIDAVWSSSIVGRIAWLEQIGDDPPTVRTRTFLAPDDVGQEAAFNVPEAARLRWYTSEGVTVETAEPEPRLVTIRPDGTRIESEPGIEFLAGSDVFALVRQDGEPVLIDRSLRVIAEFPSITGCRTGEFAPFVDQGRRRVGLSCQIQNTTLLAAFEIEVTDDGSPGEITNLGGQPILGLTSVSWAGGDRFVTTVLPINGPVPESILTVWDVEAHESEVVRWEGAMFSIESVLARRVEPS